MSKIKELLFWRFSLFSGLLALASVLALSYFYYRAQTDNSFVYWSVISNLSEYRVLDSRVSMFNFEGNLDVASLSDNLLMQRDLIQTTIQLFYDLREKDIAVPSETYLKEIEQSIFFRSHWLKSCTEGKYCDINEWTKSRYKAWESCERFLADFNSIISERENEWTKNLRFFYILSVMLLLSALFFAAGRGRG